MTSIVMTSATPRSLAEQLNHESMRFARHV